MESPKSLKIPSSKLTFPTSFLPSSNCARTKKVTRYSFFHACDSFTSPSFFPPSPFGSISRPNDSLPSIGVGMSSLPHSWSMFVCSWSCRMPRLDIKPAPAIPSTTCQTTLSASPNVSRTSSFNGCSSVGIDGIAAKASSTPCGN